MSETTLYTAYYIAQAKKLSGDIQSDSYDEGDTLSEEAAQLEAQKLIVKEYIHARHPYAEVVTFLIEYPENKKTHHWPELIKAIAACKETKSTLLIAELGTLTNNESFTKILLEADIAFHCCDQPFVNKTILEALCKHAQVQRKLHGKLIREGLKLTSARSGNPNAAEVISKVNKPKINAAIVFASVLTPIINTYRSKGYSQRQMVKMLNEEGFTAPEGGKWVLSQLQKVLDRVKLNEVAISLQDILHDLQQKDLSCLEMANALNDKEIPALKRGAWDEYQVKKVLERIEQISDIKDINNFLLHIIPLLKGYHAKGLNERQLLKTLDESGIAIKAGTTNESEHAAA